MATVSRGRAALVALAIALVLGSQTVAHERLAGGSGGDFGAFRAVTLALLGGKNPYDLGVVPYPLPSLLVIAPLTPLPPVVGAGVFTGLGVLALVYGLLRQRGWGGLAMLTSPAFFLGWYYLQWSPLIVAGALLPWLGGAGVCKPNVWIAAFAYRPRWQALVAAAALIAVSFLILPYWLTDWVHDLPQQRTPHTPPLVWPLGAVGLVGLLRWRTREGRALVAMTLSPLNPQVYDHLGVWLAVRGWRESLVLSACGWVGFLTFVATAPHDLTKDASLAHLSLTLSVYLPAAAMVLLARHGDPVHT